MRYMGRSKIRSKNYLTCRNKLLLILVTEDDSCLLCAVYLTATEVPASVKTQLLNLASLSFLLKLSYIWHPSFLGGRGERIYFVYTETG